ncbi:MAG: pyridoxal-phosphate dependent enzyme [Planctomycetia bacterium]
MSVWRFAERIAPVPPESHITLGEGNTPLIESRMIGPRAGIGRLLFKLESSNPSGSYKDRFAAVAVSAMRAAGRGRCVATSSGNTGSALAAYCARAGIRLDIALVEPAPQGKVLQMLAYGARLCRVRGFGLDDEITRRTFARVSEIGGAPGNSLEISAYRFSPVGMSGVETIAHEIAADFMAEGSGIDHVFVEAGGGGLTLAVARGFRWLVDHGHLPRSPAIHCVQPAGNDTIAGPLRSGAAAAREVICTTSISGLQVPSVIDGDAVVAACRTSGGTGHLVSDDETWEMQRRLAREEGVYCEPAGAVGVAGAVRAASRGEIQPRATVLCIITGNGSKDIAAVERMTAADPCPTVDWESLA